MGRVETSEENKTKKNSKEGSISNLTVSLEGYSILINEKKKITNKQKTKKKHIENQQRNPEFNVSLSLKVLKPKTRHAN